MGLHGAQLSCSRRGKGKNVHGSQCYTSSKGLFSPSSADLWWGKGDLPFLFAVQEERQWGVEWLSVRLTLVCLDMATEGCELSRGVQQTLQDRERQLLLRRIKWDIFV